MSVVGQFKTELFEKSPAHYGAWHAVDLHNHSPKSFDFQGNRSSALTDAVKHLQNSNLAVVMFTDHHVLPDSTFISTLAKRTGRTIIRGVELNVFVDAWAKPEDKVGRNAFFHLLVGFDPEGAQDAEYWFSHLKRTCGNTCREVGGKQIAGLTSPIEDVCSLLEDAGAIVIPAHLHTSKNAFKSRSIDDIYADDRFLDLAERCFTALEVTDLNTAAFFDGKHTETRNLSKTCIRSSDAHEVSKIGWRPSYVQMEAPTFQELRGSLEMPFRVSLVPPATPESHIVGLNIKGQFFTDLWLSLSPHCNAFIGVKGSGKTSVLECLRFALGTPVPESRREDVGAHLAAILGPSGTVRVLVKRSDGAVVLIERSLQQKDVFRMHFEDSTSTNVRNPDALMFPSYILGWHEIEQAASDSRIRQMYLDTIAGREQIRRLREKADTDAKQVEYLHEQLSGRYAAFRSLDDQVRRLRDLRAGLQELRDADLIQLRDWYESALRHREAYRELVEQLETLVDQPEGPLLGGIPIDFETKSFAGESPLSEYAKLASEVLDTVRRDTETSQRDYHQKLAQQAARLRASAVLLDDGFETFATAYSESVASLSKEQQRLLESHRQVMEDTKSLVSLELRREEEKRGLEKLLDQLATLSEGVADCLDEQTQLRTEKVASLSASLTDYGISLRVLPHALGEPFDDLANRYSNGANIFSQLQNFVPNEPRHHRRLARAYESLRRDLIDGFTLVFSSAEFIGYLGAYEGDDLAIGFDVQRPGEQFTPIGQLSAGQRCTAVFPLLMRLQEGPLIVDQPEDNLDNRHIADSIAPALSGDKRSRQITFTSHNANLVVLTDSEHIAMFEGQGSTGMVPTRGFLCTSRSKIREHVVAILDGGERALELRYRKYGTHRDTHL